MESSRNCSVMNGLVFLFVANLAFGVRHSPLPYLSITDYMWYYWEYVSIDAYFMSVIVSYCDICVTVGGGFFCTLFGSYFSTFLRMAQAADEVIGDYIRVLTMKHIPMCYIVPKNKHVEVFSFAEDTLQITLRISLLPDIRRHLRDSPEMLICTEWDQALSFADKYKRAAFCIEVSDQGKWQVVHREKELKKLTHMDVERTMLKGKVDGLLFRIAVYLFPTDAERQRLTELNDNTKHQLDLYRLNSPGTVAAIHDKARAQASKPPKKMTILHYLCEHKQ